MTSELRDLLAARAGRVGLVLSPDLAESLETYFRLLETWNRRMNLTALSITPPSPEAVDRLLIEPLVAARALPDVRTMLDVGSGSGSPAVPMALAFRNTHVIMVESKVRKSVFLREVVRALGLSAEVITARIEDVLSNRPSLRGAVDLMTVRAVRIDARLADGFEPFLSPTGNLLLFTSGAGPNLEEVRLCLFRSLPLEGLSGTLHQYVRCST